MSANLMKKIHEVNLLDSMTPELACKLLGFRLPRVLLDSTIKPKLTCEDLKPLARVADSSIDIISKKYNCSYCDAIIIKTAAFVVQNEISSTCLS